jgi:hypothetical protein
MCLTMPINYMILYMLLKLLNVHRLSAGLKNFVAENLQAIEFTHENHVGYMYMVPSHQKILSPYLYIHSLPMILQKSQVASSFF